MRFGRLRSIRRLQVWALKVVASCRWHFLPTRFGVDVRESVLELSTDEDLLELVGRELYWSPKGNFLDSGLDLKAVERIVGPPHDPDQGYGGKNRREASVASLFTG